MGTCDYCGERVGMFEVLDGRFDGEFASVCATCHPGARERRERVMGKKTVSDAEQRWRFCIWRLRLGTTQRPPLVDESTWNAATDWYLRDLPTRAVRRRVCSANRAFHAVGQPGVPRRIGCAYPYADVITRRAYHAVLGADGQWHVRANLAGWPGGVGREFRIVPGNGWSTLQRRRHYREGRRPERD